MKRLLQISLDTLLISILPIIMWVLLGIIQTKEISNVFSLTYPLQFFFLLFESLFGKGPNITAKKENNKDIVYSNMIFGTTLVGVLTIVLSININFYIRFMSMEPCIYHNFCLYSIIWLYFSFVMQLILNKLYFEDKNDESNKINIIFNFTNFFLILSLTYLTKDNIAIFVTLIIDFIMISVFFYKHFKKPKLSLNIKENIKYSSFSLLRNLCMLLTYGIGMGRSFSYGDRFIVATNFESLTTDTQWDILYSVDTVAKIDLASGKFDYKESLKNAYKLLAILIGSIIILNLTLYWYFKPDLSILLVILSIQIVDMLLDPLKTLRLDYLQINDNHKKHNLFMVGTRFMRVLCAFIPSAFCTYISQVLSMSFLLIYSIIQCRDVPVFKLKAKKVH